MRNLEDLDLPEFDHTDPSLSGPEWHERIDAIARESWLARTPLATVVLDREASEQILRSKSAKFPGREVADLFGIDSGPLREEIDRNIININGEPHRRLRSLVAPHFSPRAAESHRSAVAGIFTEVMDAALEAEVIDAQNSRVVAQVVRKGAGLSLENDEQVLSVDNVKPVIDGWASDMRQSIEQLKAGR